MTDRERLIEVLRGAVAICRDNRMEALKRRMDRVPAFGPPSPPPGVSGLHDVGRVTTPTKED